MAQTALCSYCKQPKGLLFKLIENKPNAGQVERLACFPCLGPVAEKEMAAQRKELEAAPPAPAP
jgi:hypothetical protein